MRVPDPLASAFGAPFEALISSFALERKLIENTASLQSTRFLARSIIPHVQKLSTLFNRMETEQAAPSQADGLDPYWKKSSNPANLRLAYFLYFMPSNLFRVASIWAELQRLGFTWPQGRDFKAIEFGAGPASGACGIAAGERYAPVGLPSIGNWALVEQDKATLTLGAEWAERYFNDLFQGTPRQWDVRSFHRTLSFAEPLLPKSAPRFNLWLMSYFLNEFSAPAPVVAQTLFDSWDRHLEDEGLIILVEPALKAQSRRLLELRKELLLLREKRGAKDFQVLLPCLGHQSCGALANPDDWCHEEVSWWRPPYFRIIDRLAGLDRKTLPFSYLVLAKSARKREEILPELGRAPQAREEERYRLVSPAHKVGKDLEFYLCGQDGKRRARFRPDKAREKIEETNRGSVLVGAEIKGEPEASRVTHVNRVL